MDEIAALTVTCVSEGTDVVLVVAGELDMDTVDELREAIASAPGGTAGSRIFDLAAVEFIDSSGLAALLASRNGSEAVKVRRPSPSVERLILATGLTGVIEVVEP